MTCGCIGVYEKKSVMGVSMVVISSSSSSDYVGV